MFQFLIGAIKSLVAILEQSCTTCFNSLLVRLKALLHGCIINPSWFQFLIGAIKSHLGIHTEYDIMKFQFLVGAIKRLLFREDKKGWFGFNSLLVRLKAKGRILPLSSDSVSIPYWCD